MVGSETDVANEAAAQTLAQRVWFRLEGVAERLKDIVSKMNTPEAGTTVAPAPSIGTDNSVSGRERANVNNTKIEISERTLSVLALVLGAAAIVCSFWAISESGKAEREARMLQYYVLEMDAKLIASGVKKPEEAVANKLEK